MNMIRKADGTALSSTEKVVLGHYVKISNLNLIIGTMDASEYDKRRKNYQYLLDKMKHGLSDKQLNEIIRLAREHVR